MIDQLKTFIVLKYRLNEWRNNHTLNIIKLSRMNTIRGRRDKCINKKEGNMCIYKKKNINKNIYSMKIYKIEKSIQKLWIYRYSSKYDTDI